MVVLNFYGKIEPICISEKLGLYIANLPNEEYNEWRNALAEELELAVKANKIYQEKLGTNYPCGIINLYQTLFPDELLPGEFEQEHYIKIADQMIFIYQDYDYTDMPLGGWDTNCFDGRLCEEDYSEKIIDFINFMAHSDQPDYAIPKPVPQWTFSSNHDGIDYWRIFWGGEESAEYILALQEWGKLFDSFLTYNFYIGNGIDRPSKEKLKAAFNVDDAAIRDNQGAYKVTVSSSIISRITPCIYHDLRGQLWYIESPIEGLVLPELCLHFLIISALCNIMRYSPHN